jgi:hypothetical protein
VENEPLPNAIARDTVLQHTSGTFFASAILVGNGAESMHRNETELCAQANALGITIYQRSKTVWIALGSYRGRDFEVKGRTPGPTLALWKEATRYRGSGIPGGRF